MQIVEIRKTEGGFQFSELALFLEEETVYCINVLPNNCLLVGVYDDLEIKVLDLVKGVVTKTIPNPSKDGWYNSFQSLIG